MKQLLRLLLLMLLPCIGAAQSADAPKTINAADFPVAFATGIPQIEIPLLSLPTRNAGFSLDMSLQNNLYASTNAFFSTRDIGDTWSLNTNASITIKPYKTGSGALALTRYDEQYYSELLRDSEDKDGSSIYTFNCFGLQGSFAIKKVGSQFSVRILEKNDYADIWINYTTTNNQFRIQSFIIVDKNGFQYRFENAEYIVKNETHPSTTKFLVKTAFFISKIVDNKNNILVNYLYQNNIPNTLVLNARHFSKLEGMEIPGVGKIDLGQANTIKREFKVLDLNNVVVKKIEFYFTQQPPLSKLYVEKVRFYNTPQTAFEEYKIKYKYYGDLNTPSLNQYYGFLHNACAAWNFNRNNLRFDHGSVEKITNPQGGVTFYEFEPNTCGTYPKNEIDLSNQGTPIFELKLNGIYDSNSENYYFEEVPLTYNTTYQGYIINPDDYYDATTNYIGEIFVDYKASEVMISPGGMMDPDGNIMPPRYYTPVLKVGQYWTDPNHIQENNVPQNSCYPGERIRRSDPTTKYILKKEMQYQSAYTYVKAFVRKKKAIHQLTLYSFAPGIRIKRIKTFDAPVTTIQATTNVAGEQLYHYNFFNESNTSSGYTKLNVTYDVNNNKTPDFEQNDYADLALYKNVTVATPGLGKTEYVIGEELPNQTPQNVLEKNSALARYVQSIKKYNNSNTLVEESFFERTYHGLNTTVQDKPILTQPVISYEKVTAHTYAGTTAKKLVTISESTYDTLTRNLTRRTITDVNNNQVFEEAFTFVKKHQTYFPETVKKYKNSQLLNQSAFEYTPVTGNPQVVNLSKSYVAKSTLPLEIDKEITRYDAYGNVLEYKTKTGKVVSQIWGYDGTQLIAELKNVAYNSISAATITAIQTASNAAGYNETNLNTAFTQLRGAHANGFITTYTYKPLVGMTSVTDANGRRESYQYDSFNRLYRVVNHEGQVTKEYQYNTKNQ